ncbi:response regulator [Phyllobacterium endophyticum]|uniref:Response regulator n=1 Tax=Phyllobacterium endophyticum TaxID=1149773 RepID=A0A2P7AR66_9HYPH|nr:response regulator [Phyllobacterium endophyticum]MBB3237368.1 CheY-like chemotaxis protein [Phyllobacterium endophyticum]PSH56719.1 response regulator [Phyllobacterium endophyticum]TYR44297.1 response regulator [Phyllobacterium endophyticum]
MTSIELETILLVETHPVLRATVSEYLRGCGYRVIEATNAAEAIEVLSSHEVHVLVTDVELRDASGFQLSAHAKEIRPGIKVIVTRSAERTSAAVDDLCEEGPLDHPYHPQKLADRIKRLRQS